MMYTIIHRTGPQEQEVAACSSRLSGVKIR